jgi:anti-sigma B factor antagonist
MRGSAHRHTTPPVALAVEVHRRPEQTTVRLTGEIDMVTAQDVADVLARLLDQGSRTVELDLSEVRFLSAAGLAVLLEQDRRFRRASGRLLVVAPSPVCGRLFALTGMDEVLTIR